MYKLKGHAYADKLFELLLNLVASNKNLYKKVYKISEIGEILSKELSGIQKAETYNYSMISMFSGQKGRDYFIFNKPKVKNEFTRLANDSKRNNHVWKNTYGNEKVSINPLYLQNIFPYSQVEAIRILPMSNEDPEFTNKTISEVQDWFKDILPNKNYNFKTGMNADKGTLVLFQYQAHIIAAAILDEKIMYELPIDGGYRGYYKFNPSSISTFIPLDVNDMKSIWGNFIGFKNSMQNLEVIGYINLMLLLLNKDITFSLEAREEESYQEDIERIEIHSLDVTDKPENPMKISKSKGRQYWLRSGVTAKKAIMLAEYKCEYDGSHMYFTSKVTGENYVEAHHLVPIEYQGLFEYSLDVEANIISLCPLCHKQIHHSTFGEKKLILEQLYKIRKERLQKCGIEISLKDLYSYY